MMMQSKGRHIFAENDLPYLPGVCLPASRLRLTSRFGVQQSSLVAEAAAAATATVTSADPIKWQLALRSKLDRCPSG